MRPPKAINWFRIVFLQVISCGILYFFFGWVGFVIGIPVAVIFNMIIFSAMGLRYWNDATTLYNSLMSKEFTKDEALAEISKRAHPEFQLSTHHQIVSKFNNIDLLINFIAGALPGGNKTDDQFALEILKNTSIYHQGGNKYKVVTDRHNLGRS